MNDRLSRNSLTLVGKVNGDELVFLRVRVRRNTLEGLRILSDPYENFWHSQDENVNHKFKKSWQVSVNYQLKGTYNRRSPLVQAADETKAMFQLQRKAFRVHTKIYPVKHVTLNFRDKRGTALFRQRNRAEITVRMSEHKPYPV